MDPESRRKLDRVLRRTRFRAALRAALVLLPVDALLAWPWMPHLPDGVVAARLAGFETRPSDDVTPVRMVLSLPDGGPLRLRPRPAYA